MQVLVKSIKLYFKTFLDSFYSLFGTYKYVYILLNIMNTFQILNRIIHCSKSRRVNKYLIIMNILVINS